MPHIYKTYVTARLCRHFYCTAVAAAIAFTADRISLVEKCVQRDAAVLTQTCKSVKAGISTVCTKRTECRSHWTKYFARRLIKLDNKILCHCEKMHACSWGSKEDSQRMSAYRWLTVKRSFPSGPQAILSAIRYRVPSCFLWRTFFTTSSTSSDEAAMAGHRDRDRLTITHIRGTTRAAEAILWRWRIRADGCGERGTGWLHSSSCFDCH